MRYLFAALLLTVGCASPDSKDSLNAAPNNGANNTTANNTTANNTAGSNNATSSNNAATTVVANNATTTTNGAPNNTIITPNNLVAGCTSRSVCGDNQECVDNLCVDHTVCDRGMYEGGDGACRADWDGCPDSFRFECFAEGEWFCSCTENGSTGEFITFSDNPCSQAGIQYAANAACGWLVPAIP